MIRHTPHATRNKRYAFTLIELLVSIGILALLIGLTVKGVSKMRQAAYATNTASQIQTIQAAIENFHADNHHYPGPLPNAYLGIAPPYTQPIVSGVATSTSIKVNLPATGFVNNGGANLNKITGGENLVLDLYGGLYLDSNAANTLTYDPSRVGTGAGSLNTNNPKKSLAYMTDQKLLNENWQAMTKDGHYKDDSGEADDSIVPELVDRFPQGMPILYLRASSGYEMPGANQAATVLKPDLNNVITYKSVATNGSLSGQYQLEQILGYTGAYTGTWPNLSPDATPTPAAGSKSIGEQKSIKGHNYFTAGTAVPTPGAPYHGLRTVTVSGTVANDTSATMTPGDTHYQYPYDAYPYLKNPAFNSTTTAAVARQKDAYILISPGPDRIYGTDDDITSFGTIGQ